MSSHPRPTGDRGTTAAGRAVQGRRTDTDTDDEIPFTDPDGMPLGRFAAAG